MAHEDYVTELHETTVVIDDHVLLEDGKTWQCIKDDCGFMVLPQYKGHRCMFRDEMYTEKPDVPFAPTVESQSV